MLWLRGSKSFENETAPSQWIINLYHLTVSENKARKLFRKDTSFGVIFTSTRRNFLKLQIFDTFTESSTGNWKCKQTNYLNLSKNSLHARDTCPNYLNRTGSLDAFRPLFNGGFERLICNASLWGSTFQLLSWSKIRVFCRVCPCVFLSKFSS